jgi:peptidoglycan hydrolase-like protein with peptidoglycan-binding domain
MAAVRERVAHAMTNDDVAKPAPPVPPADPQHAMLQRRDTGDDVQLLQRKLNIVGPGGAGYGTFGPKTEQAVRDFQQSHGLGVDGKVGPKTWAAIG